MLINNNKNKMQKGCGQKYEVLNDYEQQILSIKHRLEYFLNDYIKDSIRIIISSTCVDLELLDCFKKDLENCFNENKNNNHRFDIELSVAEPLYYSSNSIEYSLNADACILLEQYNESNKDDIQRQVDMLGDANINLLGFVYVV